MSKSERWRPVPETLVEVSNAGRVRAAWFGVTIPSLKPCYFRRYVTPRGYA